MKRKKMNRMTPPTAAFIAALFIDGGLSGRAFGVRAPRPFAWGREPGAGLLVRPRASTTPTALPRCLLRRLRFVWAMAWSLRAQDALDQPAVGVEARHR